MSAPMAVRFEQARAWFETQYPGNTFFATSVGQSMRGLHQHESPLGYLGHALGFSVDFAAYENPNQDDPVAQFMLRSFGGTVDQDGKRAEGDNNLDMPAGNATSKIRAMGAASVAGEALPDGSDQYLEQVGDAFNQMAETSDRFREALRADMPALRAARERWAKEGGPCNVALASAEKKLTAARKTARKKLQRRSHEPVSDAQIDQEPAVAELIQRRDEQKADLQPHLDEVLSTMRTVFAPWIKEMQAGADARRAGISQEDLDLAISPQEADEALKRVHAARTRRTLTDLLVNRRFRAVFTSIDAQGYPGHEDLKGSHAKPRHRSAIREMASRRDLDSSRSHSAAVVRSSCRVWGGGGDEDRARSLVERQGYRPSAFGNAVP
jgi:hypothetical protein